jgi:heme-degrading monooxygenase HmoA
MTSNQGRKPDETKVYGRAAIRHGNKKWGCLIMWEFQVHAGMEKRFESGYGSDGDWVRLFELDESFIGTELVRDLKAERTYVTLDFWTSQKAYDEFRKLYLVKYNALDQKYQEMTESEREVGRFPRVPGK